MPSRRKKNELDKSSLPRAELIRIPDTKARRRAVMALGDVGETYCGFPDYQFLVTRAHLEALLREGIPFEVVPEW